jgi:hypothetical protein
VKKVVFLLALSCLATSDVAQDIAPEQLAVARLKLRNFAFCECMGYVYKEHDSLWIRDGSASGYLQTGAHSLDAYDSVREEAQIFLNRKIYRSYEDAPLGMTKCLDFYNGKELDALIKRLDKEIDSSSAAACYEHWMEVHDKEIDSANPDK